MERDADRNLWKIVYALRGDKSPTYLWVIASTAARAERKAMHHLRQIEGRRCKPTAISVSCHGFVDVL